MREKVMAIYHLSITTVGRAGGALPRSAHHTGGVVKTAGALGKASYLAGERLVDRDGRVVDYRSKAEGVEYVAHILPGGGTFDPQMLWSAADNHPGMNRPTAKRPEPKSLAAFDLIVAVPRELKTVEQRRVAAMETCRWIADHFKVALSVGGHIPEVARGSSADNWHFHALISARECTPDGKLGKLQRSLDPVHCHRHGLPIPVEVIRRKWQDIANDHLERAGSSERIDCRTYKAQGIDRTPGTHRGAAETKRRRDRQRGRGATPAKEHGRHAATVQQPVPGRTARVRKEPTLTVMTLRAELAAAAGEMTARSRRATERIAAIQAERQENGTAPGIVADIGSIQGWLHDPAKQFVRAWEAADRASALRRRIRDARRARGPLRAPTPEEAADLRRAGRERARAEALRTRIKRLIGQLARLDPADRISLPPADTTVTGKRLDAIEREIARHAVRSRKGESEMELA
jgi:hypothetical protein